MRETGVPVLDLGKMLGWETLSENILTLGKVLNKSAEAEELLKRLQRRLQQVAAHLPVEQRQDAMWLSIIGGKIYGGTKGTSYHDVLRFAGLRDVVAGTVNYLIWPVFSVENVISYDPEVIVTSSRESADYLRSLPGLKECARCAAIGLW